MSSDYNSKLEDYFNDTAEKFSVFYLRRPSFKERQQVFERNIDKLLGVIGGTGQLCIDVGCGNGILSRIVAKQGCQVIGVDQSISMISLAREEAKRERLSDLTRYIEASFLGGLEEFYGKCDLIIASSVLEYIEDLSAALNEISRLLKRGGFLLVSIPNRWSVYRILERNVKFHLVSEKSYLKYQKHQLSVAEFRNIASGTGFAYVGHEYFGAPDFTYKLLPNHRNFLFGNLFLMVLRKG